jgi:amidase
VTLDLAAALRRAEFETMLYEFHAGIERYLAESDAPLTTLESLIEFNDEHADDVMPYFGQDIFRMAAARRSLEDEAYAEAVHASGDRMRETLDALFLSHDLDALVVPSNAAAWKTDVVHGDAFGVGSGAAAAISGYPSVTVPGSLDHGLPLGISFVGRPFGEAEIIGIASVFEAARGSFPAPAPIPTLEP